MGMYTMVALSFKLKSDVPPSVAAAIEVLLDRFAQDEAYDRAVESLGEENHHPFWTMHNAVTLGGNAGPEVEEFSGSTSNSFVLNEDGTRDVYLYSYFKNDGRKIENFMDMLRPYIAPDTPTEAGEYRSEYSYWAHQAIHWTGEQFEIKARKPEHWYY